MTGHSETYGLIDSFEVDEGQLEGQTNAAAFVLGVEWAQFRFRLDSTPEEFTTTAHSANVARFRSLAQARGRHTKVSWDANGWCSVEVLPKATLRLVR